MPAHRWPVFILENGQKCPVEQRHGRLIEKVKFAIVADVDHAARVARVVAAFEKAAVERVNESFALKSVAVGQSSENGRQKNVLLEGEGTAACCVAILQFPSIDAAKRWYDSPENQEAAKIRQSGGKFRLVAIEALPNEKAP